VLQVLVVLTPVILAFMAFAVDMGRLYLIQGELQTAADAMALAAATRLIGTEASTADAAESAQQALSTAGGRGNRYNFGGIAIGESSGFLTSTAEEAEFFDTAAAAIGEDDGAAGAPVAGAAARYARYTIRADAPLLFFGLLPVAFERKTPIAVQATAGRSAPLCTACGIVPIAVAALSTDDTTDFGFAPGTRYTLGYQCTGGPVPGALAGSTQRLPFLLIDRLNTEAPVFSDEATQLYRAGNAGLPGSSISARSCLSINAAENLWATATTQACNTNNVAASVRNFVCGISSRFDPVPPAVCESIPEVATVSVTNPPDSDRTELDDYAAYTGNGRRIVTVAVVDALLAEGMTVLAFRQFFLEPDTGAETLNAADQNARFAAIYIGSPAPVPQGRFDGCSITSGPGKVVLQR
jgi:Flp pilus assembly protein TadG